MNIAAEVLNVYLLKGPQRLLKVVCGVGLTGTSTWLIVAAAS